jgi:hypothetical protein
MVAFAIFFHILHLVLTEYVPKRQVGAEVLVFGAGSMPKVSQKPDLEPGEQSFAGEEARNLDSKMDSFPKQKDILSWKGLTYEIPVKGGHRTLLEDVNGWVKSGTLTALMVGNSLALGFCSCTNTLIAYNTGRLGCGQNHSAGRIGSAGVCRNRHWRCARQWPWA